MQREVMILAKGSKGLPPHRIELWTFALQVQRSTTELQGQLLISALKELYIKRKRVSEYLPTLADSYNNYNNLTDGDVVSLPFRDWEMTYKQSFEEAWCVSRFKMMNIHVDLVDLVLSCKQSNKYMKLIDDIKNLSYVLSFWP